MLCRGHSVHLLGSCPGGAGDGECRCATAPSPPRIAVGLLSCSAQDRQAPHRRPAMVPDRKGSPHCTFERQSKWMSSPWRGNTAVRVAMMARSTSLRRVVAHLPRAPPQRAVLGRQVAHPPRAGTPGHALDVGSPVLGDLRGRLSGTCAAMAVRCVHVRGTTSTTSYPPPPSATHLPSQTSWASRWSAVSGGRAGRRPSRRSGRAGPRRACRSRAG